MQLDSIQSQLYSVVVEGFYELRVEFENLPRHFQPRFFSKRLECAEELLLFAYYICRRVSRSGLLSVLHPVVLLQLFEVEVLVDFRPHLSQSTFFWNIFSILSAIL